MEFNPVILRPVPLEGFKFSATFNLQTGDTNLKELDFGSDTDGLLVVKVQFPMDLFSEIESVLDENGEEVLLMPSGNVNEYRFLVYDRGRKVQGIFVLSDLDGLTDVVDSMFPAPKGYFSAYISKDGQSIKLMRPAEPQRW